MAEPLPPLAGRVLAGRYRVLRPIARGGMAEVWEGHDEVLTRAVALKVLHAHLSDDEDFVERFRREAVAAARLAHPGIVATFDTGTDDGVVFIVMELVRGRTLRQALEESGTLSPTVAVRVGTQVAAALEHAHRAGLVHRDIKPANILLVEHDGGGALSQAKVADFGIAKLQAEGVRQLTATGAVVGTAKYLAPEQVVGRTPDARTDVYALGVVVYEMLCGRAPFHAETELATALQHVRAQPPLPGQLQPGIPAPLERAVLRAMAKDPDDRFPSAAAFATALTEGLGPPPEARVAPAEAPPGEPVTRGTEVDAVPQVVRERTPPRGVTPVPRRRPRKWVPMALLAGLGAAVVAVAAALLGGGGDGEAPSGGTARAPVAVASVSSFDPEGSDGTENEGQAGLAHDGDPGTAWATDRYRGAQYGRLKSGVGLIVRLAAPASLRRLEVRSPTRGWSASVYVGDQPGRTLAAWGRPVASRSSVDGDATFDLGGRRGGALLLWITDPGSDFRAEVAEVVVTG